MLTNIRMSLVYILAGFSLITMVIVLGFSPSSLQAQECNLECLEQQIKDLEDKKKLSEAATAPLEGEVIKLTNQIASISNQIIAAENRLQQVAKDIETREAELAGDYQILSDRVKSFYK